MGQIRLLYMKIVSDYYIENKQNLVMSNKGTTYNPIVFLISIF